jgi:hypothetical protein
LSHECLPFLVDCNDLCCPLLVGVCSHVSIVQAFK